MLYISPRNEYPRHIGDIQIEHPDFKEGDQLPDGWVKVEMTDALPYVEGKLVYELPPKEVDGKFYQSFAYRDLTEEEIQAQELEKVKNKVYNGQPLTEAEAALLVG